MIQMISFVLGFYLEYKIESQPVFGAYFFVSY